MDTTRIQLKEYFDRMGIKNVDIAHDLGLSTSTISNMFLGNDPIGHKRAHMLQEKYGISARHLLAGLGVVVLPSVKQTPIMKEQQVDMKVEVSEDINNAAIVRENASLKAENASLKAENERLRQEVDWLRSIVENSTKK